MKPARISRRHLIGAACWCGVAPCLSLAQDSVRLQDRWMVTQRFRLRVVVVAHGLVFPWAMACLPDGRLLVTERAGRMRIVEPGGRVQEPLAGLPDMVVDDQAGLLDVCLDREFADNRRLFFCFAQAAGAGSDLLQLVVASARLGSGRLEQVRILHRAAPPLPVGQHLGSRIAQDAQGRIFICLGERMHSTFAQRLDAGIGKILRLEADGSIPADNPYQDARGAPTAVWSLGHRNPQGLAFDPVGGALWSTEHGPRGGDELNLVTRGGNYGWPLVSSGTRDEDGSAFKAPDAGQKFMEPVRSWTPAVAPSGMVFCNQKSAPAWRGNLLIACLRAQRLLRLEIGPDGCGVLAEETMDLGHVERYRDVRQDAAGNIYVCTDNRDGLILRLEPQL